MKKLFVLFLLLVSCFSIPSQAYSDFTIHVRADSWMPYNGDPVSDRPGYVVELMKAIYEPAGFTLDYQILAWTRATTEVQDNKIDAIIGAGVADCPTCLFPKETAGINETYFFVNKADTWEFNGFESLKDKKIGIIDGYSYDGGEFDNYFAKGQIPWVQKATGDKAIELNIRKLKEHRLDILVENPLVLVENLERLENQLDVFKKAGKVGKSQEIFIAFAPNKDQSKNLVLLWDEGIKKLRESGKLQEILGKYHMTDWK